jgi:aminopeptidase-like protein
MHVTTGVRSASIGDRSEKQYRHTTKMEQMMARLLTEMRANQEKTEANLKEIRAG